MSWLQLGDTRACECAECGGLWVEPETLQALCAQHELSETVISALAGHVPRSAAPPDTVRYIPCPACAKLMNRVNFAHSSGVITDVCRSHGVWLDRGELQRVIGFVDGGGLAVQRAREKEALVLERRRLETLQQATIQLAMHGTEMGAVRRGAPSTPTDGLGAFLVDIAGLFS
jgi:Zn-finger nucleic acid-binding protein